MKVYCLVYLSGSCPKFLCENTFSEIWTRGLFHEGIGLEVKILTADEVFIDELALSENIKCRLKEAQIISIKDIIDSGELNLRKTPQIVFGRSSEIYRMEKEYRDDNLESK